jgi:hypothetical protein
MSDDVAGHARAHVNAQIAHEVDKAVATVSRRTSSPSSGAFALLRRLMKPNRASSQSKYTRYTVDKETFTNAVHAVPSVYKFFLLVFRLSPLRTLVILAVFMVQGFLPAVRLRTGGDFIREVCCSSPC